jgi:hypothetical protein
MHVSPILTLVAPQLGSSQKKANPLALPVSARRRIRNAAFASGSCTLAIRNFLVTATPFHPSDFSLLTWRSVCLAHLPSFALPWALHVLSLSYSFIQLTSHSFANSISTFEGLGLVTNSLLLVVSLNLRQLHVRAGSESNRGRLTRTEAHLATRCSLHGSG